MRARSPPGIPADTLAAFALDEVAQRYGLDRSALDALVDDLAAAGKRSLVLAGPSLPLDAHAAVALLNSMLGAEGYTVDATRAADAPSVASAAEMAQLTRDLDGGTYAAAIIWEANPSYAVSDAGAFDAALAGVPLKIRLGLHADETAARCDVVLPVNHWLESWNDFEPSRTLLSLQQPLIRPLYDTRQGEEILLAWAKALGAPVVSDYRAYLMMRWERAVYPKGTLASFQKFWVTGRARRACSVAMRRRDRRRRSARTAWSRPRSMRPRRRFRRHGVAPRARHPAVGRPVCQHRVVAGAAGAGDQGELGQLSGSLGRRREAAPVHRR